MAPCSALAVRLSDVCRADACCRGSVDSIDGVSESIIMGIPMPTGTGLFKLRQSYAASACSSPAQRPLPILAYE